MSGAMQGATAVSADTAKPSSADVPHSCRHGKKYKIQVQMSDKAKDRLFELVDTTGSETAAQVIRDAIRVYDVLIQEAVEKNGELFLKDADGEITRLRVF